MRGCCGLALIAPHFFVEDVTIASIAAIARQPTTQGGLRDAAGALPSRRRRARSAAGTTPGSNPGFRGWDITRHARRHRVADAAAPGRRRPLRHRRRRLRVASGRRAARCGRVLIPGGRALAAPRGRRPRPLDAIARFAGTCLRHELYCALVTRMIMHIRQGAPRCSRIDFQTEPARYRHWRLRVRRPGRASGHGRRPGRLAVRRLRAEAQLLRSRRRHRARRRGAAPALRAPRGARAS